MPKDFAVICNELTYLGQVVLQGTRIVIPEKLWNRVLDLSHEGHQGNVKTKEHLPYLFDYKPSDFYTN